MVCCLGLHFPTCCHFIHFPHFKVSLFSFIHTINLQKFNLTFEKPYVTYSCMAFLILFSMVDAPGRIAGRTRQ